MIRATPEQVQALWDARNAAFDRLHEANEAGLDGAAAGEFMAAMDHFRERMDQLCRPYGKTAWMLDVNAYTGEVTVIRRPRPRRGRVA
jgi:hypothetical protein